MLTTTSITAVSVSTRSAQVTCRSPELIHGNSAMRASWCMKPTSTSAIHDSPAATSSNPVVISSAARDPAAGGSTDVMIVVAVIVMRVRLVVRGMNDAGIFGDRRRAVAMRIVVMLDRVAARIARMRAEYRDQAREYRADQRQEDDCLDHPRSLSVHDLMSENR